MKIKVTKEDIEYGLCGVAGSCPVARAVQRQVDKCRSVMVTRNAIYVTFADNTKKHHALEQGLWERVTLFDIERRMTPFDFELTLV